MDIEKALLKDVITDSYQGFDIDIDEVVIKAKFPNWYMSTLAQAKIEEIYGTEVGAANMYRLLDTSMIVQLVIYFK